MSGHTAEGSNILQDQEGADFLVLNLTSRGMVAEIKV